MFAYKPRPLKQPRKKLPTAAKWLPIKLAHPPPCDACMQLLIENEGSGPLSRKANLKRIATDGSEWWVCFEHSVDVRSADDQEARRKGL